MNEEIKPTDKGTLSGANGASSNNDLRLIELAAETERLKAELAQTRLERDDYLKALYKLAPEYMFTAEEIEEMIANQGSGRVFMEEILKSLTEAA